MTTSLRIFFLSLAALLVGLGGARAHARESNDVLLGPADPSTTEQWQTWIQRMEAFRAERRKYIGMTSGLFPADASAWSDGAFRQYFLFMYDEAFLRNGTYRTSDWLTETERRLGRIDAVLLWQAYPQLGIDSRDQLDFYRRMPGGLAGLRREVSDVLHARGVRVILDFNPWDDHPDYDQLAQVAVELDADGVMLDTLSGVPDGLRQALDRRKPGIVLMPEDRPKDEQLPQTRATWAQWYDLGSDQPAIYRQKWILPQQMLWSTRRWDTDHSTDIVFSFFNGSGVLLWDNIFGSWNPYQAPDRKLLAETSVVLHAYQDLFVHGRWTPLLPSGAKGLDVNRWDLESSALGPNAILTFRNRTDHELSYSIPAGAFLPDKGLRWFSLWGQQAPLAPGAKITIRARGTQALVLDQTEHALAVMGELERAGKLAAQADGSYDERTPEPRPLNLSAKTTSPAVTALMHVPGGTFEMRVEHERRESGCYSLGAGPDALWGWFFKDRVVHRIESRVEPFLMSKTAVTNAQFLRFVAESGYRPMELTGFLRHIPRNQDGSLPVTAPHSLADLPVTQVSLEDARAYAKWDHTRLPTEAEWQWAAQGAGANHLWPWGDQPPESAPQDSFNRTGRIARADAYMLTPQGIAGLSGNVWELTDSEWSDGHNRFVMLRGGTYLEQPAQLSEWMLPRGAHPNSFHAKYFLVSPGMDRSETIGFRVVMDVPR